jgi:PAS domain S-box-containing protein
VTRGGETTRAATATNLGHDGGVTTATAGPSDVRLVGLPVGMMHAAAEQWESMLREYALRGMGGQQQPYSAEEITQAGTALATVSDATYEVDAAAAEVSVQLSEGMTTGLSLLQGILDDARHLAIAGDLLVLPPLPEVVALRDWICGEATEQAAGADPCPWSLVVSMDDPADTAAPEWDASLVPPADRAWLVGDDRNRIVAASPAALRLLGWTAEELLGQRLLVVIPHALREAHIAGFTRSVVSGHGDLLGRPLDLPALTREGAEVPITLTLTRHAARAGRHVYLAQLDSPA